MITCGTINAYEGLLAKGGPRFRSFTAGAEWELVEDYLAQWLSVSDDRHCELTVFVEPELASGYPDVVAVYWNSAVAVSWPLARSLLTPTDLRALHHAYLTRRFDELRLSQLIGRNKFPASLARLEAADVLERRSRSWRLRPISDVFAVTRLVAIEAKMAAARRGLNQAFHNTWFASESYLLVPALPRDAAFLRAAERLGVGVISETESLSKPKVRRDRLPKSYASWLFNEWAWRSAL